MEGFCFVLIGYITGCIQSAYIYGKIFHGEDIRNSGSGNPGTMNTFEQYGILPAIAVLLCDVLKTIFAVLLCMAAFPGSSKTSAIALGCLGAAIGHNFPFWIGFRGGKGVAVAVAFLLIIDIRILLLTLSIAAVFALITKSLTYGSYTFAIMMFICCEVFNCGAVVAFCALMQSLMIIMLHLKRQKAAVVQ